MLRNEKRGTRDEGKKWEGEAPAEPKRRRFANSDWRMVKRQNNCTPHPLFTFARLHTYTHARLHAHRLKPVARKVSEHAIGLFTSGKEVA